MSKRTKVIKGFVVDATLNEPVPDFVLEDRFNTIVYRPATLTIELPEKKVEITRSQLAEALHLISIEHNFSRCVDVVAKALGLGDEGEADSE